MTHELAVIAAWLHDIGKFAQRAGAPASRGMEQEYCPGGQTHRHVLYTDFFIEHVLPLPPELEGCRSALARLASAHHRPDAGRREELALQQADRLSAGGDRMESGEKGDFKKARLESIFSQVRLGGKRMPDQTPPLRYGLLPLDAEKTPIFPESDPGGSYEDLYAGFCAALREMPLDMGTRVWLDSLVSLLECHTWCIPSSTYYTKADISLYDHAATTAAIVQALLACPAGNERLLLFGGDLSGIQAFIFGQPGQADKGASKLLRARSLLLQAVTRSIWLALLDRLDLSKAARIMDAGGRFVLLLPDTAETRAAIEHLEYEAQAWLCDTFQGSVRMAFARHALAPDDLRRERFISHFEAFNDALEQAKLRPFTRLLERGMSPILKVNHADYSRFGECEHCHARPAAQAAEDDEPASCDLCLTLIQKIGKRLPTARYLVFSRHDGMPLFDHLTWKLTAEKPAASQARQACDIVDMKGYGAFSSVPIAGYLPRDDKGQPKTFAMLADEARVAPAHPGGAWRAIPCLAACKADVDNLGLLFGTGFGTGEKSAFSISRFAMLARMMNFFFAAWLPRLIEREFPDVYIIFAGGDDLFVVGPWDQVVFFARRLHADFTRFAGGNQAVTLSAGLPLFKPRLPMRGIREEAEDALECSKDAPGKNAATLFGVTAAWPDFDTLLDQGEWLEGLALSGALTQGMLRRMLGYARDCRDFTDTAGQDLRKGLYLAHFDYDLARNADGEKLSAADMTRLKQLGQNEKTFPQAEMSLSWALYRTRTS